MAVARKNRGSSRFCERKTRGIEWLKRYFYIINRTLVFSLLLYLAKQGWLAPYVHSTSYIGIFCFYILILCYPVRAEIKTAVALLPLFLTFFLVLLLEEIALSFIQWLFILISYLIPFWCITDDEQDANAEISKFSVKSLCSVRKCVVLGSLLLLVLWFFYPYVLQNWLGFENEDPYENLGSLLAGAALVSSALAIVMQGQQLRLEKETSETQLRLANKQKIESALFECMQRYTAVSRECGKERMDALYETIRDVYVDINQFWQYKKVKPDIRGIAEKVDTFHREAVQEFALSLPLEIYAKLIVSTPIDDDEKSQYFSLFINGLPKREQAILLTCFYSYGRYGADRPYYLDYKNGMHFLFNEMDDYNESTETFFNVVSMVVCLHPDEPLEYLLDYIRAEKERCEEREEQKMEKIRKQFRIKS